MTLPTKQLFRVGVCVAVTVALTLLLWPLIQGASVTPLAVAGGIAASNLVEDRISGHDLHWGGALASGALSGVTCQVVLRLLTP